MYRDVPPNVYPLGINIIEEGEYNYQIATPEKALCDKLYTLNPIKNMSELKNVLFNDLRIDYYHFIKLNLSDIETLSNYYHCTNVDLSSIMNNIFNLLHNNKKSLFPKFKKN